MGKIKIIATFVALATILGCNVPENSETASAIFNKAEYRQEMYIVHSAVVAETDRVNIAVSAGASKQNEELYHKLLREVATNIAQQHDRAALITPPNEFDNAHEHYLKYVENIALAAEDIYVGATTGVNKEESYNKHIVAAEKERKAAESLINFITKGE